MDIEGLCAPPAPPPPMVPGVTIQGMTVPATSSLTSMVSPFLFPPFCT